MAHDALGDRSVQSRNAREEWRAGSVQLHTHRMNTRLHDFTQLSPEARLKNIVLILPHTDALWIQLDELREWILQATRDANGAAHREVEIRELLASHFARRVDAG